MTEAPLSTITGLSWVLGSHSLAVCSWVLGSHSLAVFFSFIHFETTLAQVYDIYFVINRVNILLVRLGIWVFDLHLIYHLVVVCSSPTVSCDMTLFLAHVAFFIVARFSFAFAFAVDLAFALALIAILALSLLLPLLLLPLLPLFLRLLLPFCSCLCSPRPSELFL